MINLLAAAHANRAWELMNVAKSDPELFDEHAKQAAEQLRIAAGMFDYLARKAIFKWKSPPPETPYECNATIAAAQRNLCISAGQGKCCSLFSCSICCSHYDFVAIVVKKAKLAGTSETVVSKLCAAGFKQAENAFKAVIGMRDAACVHTNFKDFLCKLNEKMLNCCLT